MCIGLLSVVSVDERVGDEVDRDTTLDGIHREDSEMTAIRDPIELDPTTRLIDIGDGGVWRKTGV